MSEAKKVTPGEWHIGGREKCTVYDKFGQRIANTFEGVMVSQRSDDECKANAEFIAEAGTVHHETGLTPRQLVEQRDALAKALELAISALSTCTPGDCSTGHVIHPYFDEEQCGDAEDSARAALALVKGEAK